MQSKKLVDLIIVEPEKNSDELLQDAEQKVKIWTQNLKVMQEKYFEEDFDSSSQSTQEIMGMRRLISKFISYKIDWVAKKVTDPELKKAYLKVLPPFHQKGGIHSLLLHFFQVQATEDKKGLQFRALNDSEKEVRILWDLYKVMKTIESIDVLIRECKASQPFPSIFPIEKRAEILTDLKTVFRLMFQMIIQGKYQNQLYKKLKPSDINAEAILERREQGESFIYSHVLKKFDYRNHFFFIYFNEGMKAKIKGEEKVFKFNYLDFEVLKQEFLLHWMNQKLRDNPKKNEIYKTYQIEQETLYDKVQKHPDQEIEILKELPIDAFNDLTAQVNEVVEDHLKTTVDCQSENYGEYAEMQNQVGKAKRFAQTSMAKLKSFVSKKKEEEGTPALKVVESAPEPEPEPVEEVKPHTYEVIKIKKNEIDFPFLTQNGTEFTKIMNQIRTKMGPSKYKELSKFVHNTFTNVSESSLIQRRTPKHEWVMPFMIKENRDGQEKLHLLIIGAEVKSKQLGMGYSAGGGSTHQFTAYFHYGTYEEEMIFGSSIGQRNVRGKFYHMYNQQDSLVHERLFELLKVIENN